MSTDSNFNSSIKPQQAVEELLGEQFVEWLQNFIDTDVKNWDELKTIAAIKPKVEKIKKFMLQRFLAVEVFLGGRDGDPGFLGFALANLSESNDPQAESALELLEKKRQEELSSNKPALWAKLLHALGVGDEELKRAERKEPTRNYIAELSDLYSNSEWQTAMGAIVVQDKAEAEEYKAILQLLTNNTQVTEDDLKILRLPQDSERKSVNSHVLDKIVFDQENKNLVWQGVRRHLDARREFYRKLLRYLES